MLNYYSANNPAWEIIDFFELESVLYMNYFQYTINK